MKGLLRLTAGAVLLAIAAATAQADEATPSREAMQQTVDAFWNAASAMDVDGMMATFADDAVSQEPYGFPAMEGADAIRQFFQGMAGAFQSISFTRDQVHIAGNRAAVAWQANGTMADGTEVSFDGIDVVEFDGDGKIQRLWGYFEPLPLPGAG